MRLLLKFHLPLGQVRNFFFFFLNSFYCWVYRLGIAILPTGNTIPISNFPAPGRPAMLNVESYFLFIVSSLILCFHDKTC